MEPQKANRYPSHLRKGNWTTCAVSGDVAWPSKVTHIAFRGYNLILIPAEDSKDERIGGLFPMVAFEHTGLSFEEGQRVVASFLSSVAWVERRAVVAEEWSGGSMAFPIGGRRTGMVANDRFRMPYLPEPSTDRDRMALAFFREGLSLNNAAYQCLSFFKVLNLVLGNGTKQQIPWIEANYKAAMKRGFDSHDWEKKARLGGKSVGAYLYGENRSAVAHAEMEPIVDPDDPDDRRRMFRDLPMCEHSRSTASRLVSVLSRT